jgi:tRNA threonylcarbamoyladenosine modification (KEOPS) complex Cgi121 subunit
MDRGGIASVFFIFEVVLALKFFNSGTNIARLLYIEHKPK